MESRSRVKQEPSRQKQLECSKALWREGVLNIERAENGCVQSKGTGVVYEKW